MMMMMMKFIQEQEKRKKKQISMPNLNVSDICHIFFPVSIYLGTKILISECHSPICCCLFICFCSTGYVNKNREREKERGKTNKYFSHLIKKDNNNMVVRFLNLCAFSMAILIFNGPT